MLAIATECTVGLECRRPHSRRGHTEKQCQRDSGRRTTVQVTHGDARHNQQRKESRCFHRSVTLEEAHDGGLPATSSSHVWPTRLRSLSARTAPTTGAMFSIDVDRRTSSRPARTIR